MRTLFTYVTGSLLMTTIILCQANWKPPTSYDGISQQLKSEYKVASFTPPHSKALNQAYTTKVKRKVVPTQKVSWHVPFAKYAPTDWTNPEFLNPNSKARKLYAQSPDIQYVLKTKEYGGITSFYPLHFAGVEKRPINPMGRTGLAGRGNLGHWGANKAVDAILLRKNPTTHLAEVFLIYRKANQIQALPGGMQEGDSLDTALTKEVREEIGPEMANKLKNKKKHLIYQGYVDDPRNTDNAWMETTAFAIYFTPDEAKAMHKFNPTDIDEVDSDKNDWVPLKNIGKLFASHNIIINTLLKSSSYKNWR